MRIEMIKFEVGQEVEVYQLMNPLRDLKIKDIGPMYSGGEDMVWLEGISGAWHPKALKRVSTP
jgi:hypothetical protein